MFRPPSIRSAARSLAAVAALSTIVAACTGESFDDAAAPPATTVDDEVSAPATDPPSDGEEVSPVVAALLGDDAELTAAAVRRCTVAVEVMERRIDDEGFEWPDDEDEPTEEQLEEMLAPEYVNVDGVAAIDERPDIEPMGSFDPETAPIPDLDRLVGACLEFGVVTEAELFGEEDGDWCEELASIDIADLAVIAEEEGEEAIAADFAECDLVDPRSS